MSYAGQQIEYAIVSKEYVNEIEFLNRYLGLCDCDVVLETISYFKVKGLIDPIFAIPFGHRVNAKFKGNTNEIIQVEKPYFYSGEIGKQIFFYEILEHEGQSFEIGFYKLNVVGNNDEIIKLAQDFLDIVNKYGTKIHYKITDYNVWNVIII